MKSSLYIHVFIEDMDICIYGANGNTERQNEKRRKSGRDFVCTCALCTRVCDRERECL